MSSFPKLVKEEEYNSIGIYKITHCRHCGLIDEPDVRFCKNCGSEMQNIRVEIINID